MYKHERWKTIKEVKDELNKYDDNCLVFIQPHKYMVDYPFYIYQSGNKNIYFRFYDDSLLKEPLKLEIRNIQFWIQVQLEKWRNRNGTNNTTKNNS